MSVLKSSRTNILLALSSFLTMILLCAAGLEIDGRIKYNQWKASFDIGLLKTLTVKSQNPILIWEYRPYGETTVYNITLKMNRHGFRGADIPKEKPLDRQRIAMIGDSITLGIYVSNEDTLASQLELALNRDKKLVTPVEVLNFGVDGYNTLQIGELLRTRVLDFSPDVVVYIYCPNDFDFEDSSGSKILYFKKPASFFALSLKKAWRRLQHSEFHHIHFKKNRDAVYKELLSMRDTLAQKKIRFLVAMIPIFSNPSFDSYPLKDMDEDVERFLDENAIKHVNLLDAFRATGKPPGALAWDIWHPKREGNLIISAELVQPVLEALKGAP